MERQLISILAVDVCEYSAHMETSEEKTASQLEACQSLIAEIVADLGGRVFNTAGDSALAAFSSPVNTVRCGVELQRRWGLHRSSSSGPALELRVGSHIADVIVSGDNYIGDGINIAARIQEVAEPNSVYASESLFSQVRRQSPYLFEEVGAQSLKNIDEEINVYKVVGDNPTPRFISSATKTNPGTAKTQESSIVVLPFRVAADDEEQRYFADGLTDDVIAELSRFKRMYVSSPSAGLAYESRRTDPRTVGKELGVRNLLEGDIRRFGENVRISVRLVDTKSGETIWADKFTGGFAELFDLLDELVARIVGTVSGRVEAAHISESRRKRPEDMSAYDLLLRGLEYHRLGGVTMENAREAVRWFQKAIDRDPNYGIAYAWHVCASSTLPEFDEDQGFRYIQRAMELDEFEPEVHRIMGAYQMYYRDYETAEYHYLRAIELNPSDVYLKATTALFFNFKGEPARALELMDEAESRDPFLPSWCVEERGVALFGLGRYEDALAAFSALPNKTFRSRCYESVCYSAMGDDEAAAQAVSKALQIYPDLTARIFGWSELYRRSEDWEAIRGQLIGAGLPK